jgi:hypothetical protein
MDTSEVLTASMVNARVRELFPGDEATPAVKPVLPPVVGTPTNDLAILTFDAAKKVKVIRGVRAREFVTGFLFGDLLGVEVLEAEALRLGENVRKAAIAAKEQEQALKNAASAVKSKLKKKAEKDAELAARLGSETQKIDEATAADCAEVRQKEIKPAGLPDLNTVLVETRPTAADQVAREPAAHVCSDACQEGMCPRAKYMYDMATSPEAACAIVAAYTVWWHSRQPGDSVFNEPLQIAQVRYSHALRRLKFAYPGEFCGFSEQSYKEMMRWTVAFESLGHAVPAARKVAAKVGFPLQVCAAEYGSAYEEEEAASEAANVGAGAP